MQLNEIKVDGIYKTTLKVQLRNEKEIKEIDFLIRVRRKTQSGVVEFMFMNDPNNEINYLEPCQIDNVV